VCRGDGCVPGWHALAQLRVVLVDVPTNPGYVSGLWNAHYRDERPSRPPPRLLPRVNAAETGSARGFWLRTMSTWLALVQNQVRPALAT